MADISRITLPSGTTYDIKDAVARAALAGGMLAFIGVPSKLYSGDEGTTEVPTSGEGAFADGNTTVKRVVLSSVMNIRGASYDANDVYAVQNGDTMVVGNGEYVATVSSGSVTWHAFGDTTSLGVLAYKDSGSVTFTPSGTASITGTTSASVSAEVISDQSSPTFDYQPAGSVSAPIISRTSDGSTETIHNPTKATVALSVTSAAPGDTLSGSSVTYYAVSNETLSLYQIGYTTGDSITTSDVTVKTGDASYSASDPAFTGTKVGLSVNVPNAVGFTGTEQTVSVSFS